MASIKLAYNFADAKPGFPASFNPNRGFRWRIKSAHLALQASAVAATRRLVLYLAQDVGGPHGTLLVDTGPVTANQLGVGEGGPSASGFFSAAANESTFVSWTTTPEVETFASLVIANPSALQAGDTWELRVNLEEVPAGDGGAEASA